MKVAAVLLLTLIAIPFAQDRPSAGHFRLVPANSTEVDSLGIKTDEHRVFLIDESTGYVWEYSQSIFTPQQADGKIWFKSSGFYRVYIDGIDRESQRPKMAPSDMRLSK